VSVFGILAVDDAKIEILKFVGDGADAAGADFYPIDFGNRSDFGAGTGEKNFVGGGQLTGHNFSLEGGYAQLLLGQLDDSVSGDAFQDILIQRGSK